MRAVSLLMSRMDAWLADDNGAPGPGLRGTLLRALRSDFVHKVLEIFLTRIALIPLGVITGVLIARILGPEGRGLFAVAGAIGAIGVQFGNLGLHSANTYTVARDRSRLPELLGNSLLVSLAMGAAGALVAMLIVGFRPDLSPLPRLLLALTIASIPLNLAYLLCQNLLLGIQEVRTFNKIELTSRLLTVGLILLVIVFGIVTPETVFVAGLVAAVINLGWVVRRLRGFLDGAPRVSLALLRENVGYGLKAYLACLFGFLVIRFDLLMVQYMQGAEQSGYYSISITVADLLYLLPTAIGAVLFPRLAAMETREEKWALTLRTAGIVAAMMVGIAMPAIALGRPLIGLVYGAEFLPAVASFRILAAAMIFLGVTTVFSNYLASVGLPWFTVHVWLVLMLVNVGLNLVLIPSHGTAGAAWASLVCYLLALTALGLYAARYRPPADA